MASLGRLTLVLVVSKIVRALPVFNLQHRLQNNSDVEGPNATTDLILPHATTDLVLEGAAQIDEALSDVANSTVLHFLSGLNETMMSKSLPKLQRIQRYQVAAAQQGLDAEALRQQKLQGNTKNESGSQAVLNRRAMITAAEEFGLSHAQNAMARALGPAMNESISVEETAEEFRVETARFAHSAAVSADQATDVSQAAKKVSKLLPKAEAEKALVWIREVEEEARALQDEGAQSERLAQMADEVMKSAGSVADTALQRAKDAETNATKALDAATANANRIAKLHQRAFRAEEKASAAENAIESEEED